MVSKLSTWWKKKRLSRKAGGCNDQGMIRCVKSGKIDLIKELVSFGVSTNSRDESGRSALSVAVRQGDWKLTNTLLALGAGTDIADPAGMTALMEAISTADKHIFQRLLDENPELDKRNQAGETALYLAVKEGSTTFSRLLIQAGAEINLADKKGITPLMLSVMDSKTAIITSLLEHGADPLQKDLSGRSAMDIPVSSPRIRNLLAKQSGESTDAPDPESGIGNMMSQVLESATQWLGPGDSSLEIEQKGRQLFTAWRNILGLSALEPSEETMKSGAGILLLLMQEVQRGLKQMTDKGNIPGDQLSRNWENLEKIVSKMAAQLPKPDPDKQPEQHIHFHLPSISQDHEQDLNQALSEAVTVGADRAVELLTKLGEVNSNEKGTPPIQQNEVPAPDTIKELSLIHI